jgi:hypothetical protein
MEQYHPTTTRDFWARLALIPRLLIEVFKDFFTFPPTGFTLVKRGGKVFVVKMDAKLRGEDLEGAYLRRADLR